LEIVSEPDMRSAEEARAYGETLREILVYLDVNSGDMERGVMRFEANVSVRPIGSKELGARHEIKNLNSFRALYESILYEIDHQVSVLEDGGEIEPQTMGWNEVDAVTVPQRGKEFAHDYRYFPEPDIPPLKTSRDQVEDLRNQLPELPKEKRARFTTQYGLSNYDATLLVEERAVADYFERVVEEGVDAKQAANWITGELFRLMKTADREMGIDRVPAQALAELIRLVEEDTINQSTGKDVLVEMFNTGRRAGDIVSERGLAQISDTEALSQVVTQTLDDNPEQVEEYLTGKRQVLSWFIGQVMRATQGKANPQMARGLLEEQLEAKRG
jgi:aspartyl-tRNA(Asn)/glutamyl-tRNA(Gln) amidotransferase subunit B